MIAANKIEWLSPQSEYRPTEYVQGWVSFWFDEEKRLDAAKQLQTARIKFMQTVWAKDRDLIAGGFNIHDEDITTALNNACARIAQAPKVSKLLQIEAELNFRELLNENRYDFI